MNLLQQSFVTIYRDYVKKIEQYKARLSYVLLGIVFILVVFLCVYTFTDIFKSLMTVEQGEGTVKSGPVVNNVVSSWIFVAILISFSVLLAITGGILLFSVFKMEKKIENVDVINVPNVPTNGDENKITDLAVQELFKNQQITNPKKIGRFSRENTAFNLLIKPVRPIDDIFEDFGFNFSPKEKNTVTQFLLQQQILQKKEDRFILNKDNFSEFIQKTSYFTPKQRENLETRLQSIIGRNLELSEKYESVQQNITRLTNNDDERKKYFQASQLLNLQNILDVKRLPEKFNLEDLQIEENKQNVVLRIKKQEKKGKEKVVKFPAARKVAVLSCLFALAYSGVKVVDMSSLPEWTPQKQEDLVAMKIINNEIANIVQTKTHYDQGNISTSLYLKKPKKTKDQLQREYIQEQVQRWYNEASFPYRIVAKLFFGNKLDLDPEKAESIKEADL